MFSKLIMAAGLILAGPAMAQTYTNTWSWTATGGTSPGSIVSGTVSGFQNGTNLSAANLVFEVTQAPYADLLGTYAVNTEPFGGANNQYTAVDGVITKISTKYGTGVNGNTFFVGLNIDQTGPGYAPELRNSLFTGASEDLFAGKRAMVFAAVVPSVPEPAMWAMMLVGFGMVAGAARYRRRKTAVTFA